MPGWGGQYWRSYGRYHKQHGNGNRGAQEQREANSSMLREIKAILPELRKQLKVKKPPTSHKENEKTCN